MTKKLSCWLGRHTWANHVEEGESYKVCSACGTTPRGPMGDIQGPPHTYFGWRGGSDSLVDDNPPDKP